MKYLGSEGCLDIGKEYKDLNLVYNHPILMYLKQFCLFLFSVLNRGKEFLLMFFK
jgi:hypothetical protein